MNKPASIFAGIALNLEKPNVEAALPLLQSGEVEAIEWSFDTLFQLDQIPIWFRDLLLSFAEADRLIGHGVFFSLFLGKYQREQDQWLRKLNRLVEALPLAHVTEHFGFMTGQDFHKGAPLSIPMNPTTLSIGQDRLQRIQQACGLPVGLENLAFAYHVDDVKRQAAFLSQLLEPVNGFLILDLHNIYCQLHNFDLSIDDILAAYDLERVREIHISGGSWASGVINGATQIRRDTHDSQVPDTVLGFLEKVIPLCINLRYVILEQLGASLHMPGAQAAYQQDFRRMQAIVKRFDSTSKGDDDFTPPKAVPLGPPLEAPTLYSEQLLLSDILESSPNLLAARQALATSSLAQTDWQVEKWDDEMLATAIELAQKWN